jgi:hypothetical protein
MIKYGLLACLMVSVAGISAMEIRQDLKDLSFEELIKRQQANFAAMEAFDKKYTSDEWRRDNNLRNEMGVLCEEECALFKAIGAFSRCIQKSLCNKIEASTKAGVIKPHCITIDQSDETSSSNGIEELPSLKKHCLTLAQIEEEDDQCRQKEDVKQSKKAKNGSTKENLKARIQALRDEQDSLFKNLTNHSNKERIAERSNEIENELIDLNKQLKALPWSVK